MKIKGYIRLQKNKKKKSDFFEKKGKRKRTLFAVLMVNYQFSTFRVTVS